MALTDVMCKNASVDGPRKLADAEGLYLLLLPSGKYWRWDYKHGGKRKTMALGVYPRVTLAKARARRDEERLKLDAGTDPMHLRKSEKLARVVAAGNDFESVARAWHKSRSKKWAAVTSTKVISLLEADLIKVIGSMPITDVRASHLGAALKRVADRGAAYTATRLRELASQIFRFAMAHGITERNPAADLMGTIEVPETVHRPAITDPRLLQRFLHDLKQHRSADSLTLSATKLALLTFVRSQELRLAEWAEVDFEAKEWRVPAGRMKTGKGLSQAHLVPLCPQAIVELHAIQSLELEGKYVFPNVHGGDKHMSENTIGRLLNQIGYKGVQSLHGFRATARSILSERGWSEAALERQLDHKETNKVKAAYARSQHVAERRSLMDDWGALIDELEKTPILENSRLAN